MALHSPVQLPEVTDEDVRRVCGLLGLCDDAFCGADGCDPRAGVLKRMDTFDVAACPGSGKTTLLVAKLAILAEKWPYRTRGICVLSHTNAARREIETRLGNTTAGRSLLRYPHFIGTIQRFVGAYLALPWLRSQGYSVRMVDSEVTRRRRWRALPPKLQYALRKKHLGPEVLSATSADFDTAVPFGPDTPTSKACTAVCRASAKEGFFCFDEMFVFGKEFLAMHGSMADAVRQRFPLLFLDETQDNSERQSAILHRIFMEGSTPVVRQRFGDCNQAIFERSADETGATTDPFPSEHAVRDIPDSHRFGQTIAKLADPLGLHRYEPNGLVGRGPAVACESGAEPAHTLFLFGEKGAAKVLPAYAELLLDTFSPGEIARGSFVAVGHRHQRPDGNVGPQKYPCYVGNYWDMYDPETSGRDPKPKSMVQYIAAGRARTRASGEAYCCADMIAAGVLRLASMVDSANITSVHAHSHRYLLRLLEQTPTARDAYETLVYSLAAGRESLTEETWKDQWRDVVAEIAGTLVDGALPAEVDPEFLDWPAGAPEEKPSGEVARPRDNIYQYSDGGRDVDIVVGSIHSAKGETHTATLVLETFWYKHNLASLIPWVSGEKDGADGKTRQDSRLKVHYVAMTRPTHLLCLAMRRDCFADEDALAKVQARGWHVRKL